MSFGTAQCPTRTNPLALHIHACVSMFPLFLAVVCVVSTTTSAQHSPLCLCSRCRCVLIVFIYDEENYTRTQTRRETNTNNNTESGLMFYKHVQWATKFNFKKTKWTQALWLIKNMPRPFFVRGNWCRVGIITPAGSNKQNQSVTGPLIQDTIIYLYTCLFESDLYTDIKVYGTTENEPSSAGTSIYNPIYTTHFMSNERIIVYIVDCWR